MVGDNCEPEWLSQRLVVDGGIGGSTEPTVLVLDCRCLTDYQTGHILGAVHLTVPTLMLRRLERGHLPIESVINCQEGHDRFARQWKSAETIVLHDENTRDIDDVTSSSSDEESRDDGMTSPAATSMSRHIMSLLLKRLKEEGFNVRWLEGGYRAFSARYPELCSTSATRRGEDDSQSTILGLGCLHLSSSGTSGGRGGRNGTHRGSNNHQRTNDIGGENDLKEEDGEGEGEDCDSQSPDNAPRFPVEVLPHLYLGDATNSADLENLAKNGIRYILNVTPNVPNKFETNGDFRYMQIPISDHWSQNLTAYFPEAIAFIDEARRKKCGVLVHCLAGISRSVTITVAYLMHSMTLSLNDAYDHVKRCKPNISPNFNFMGQLMDYERTLRLERDYNACDCTCGAVPRGVAVGGTAPGGLGDPQGENLVVGGGLTPCICRDHLLLADSRTCFSSPVSSLSSRSSTAATSSSSSATSSSAFDYEMSSTHS